MLNKVYLDPDKTLSLKELECPHCHQVKVHPDLVAAWVKLRKRVGQPIRINSGYRCWQHHENIYKQKYPNAWQQKITKNSYHLKGMALDLAVPAGLTATEFLNLAKWAGFTYAYIISPTAIHVDVR